MLYVVPAAEWANNLLWTTNQSTSKATAMQLISYLLVFAWYPQILLLTRKGRESHEELNHLVKLLRPLKRIYFVVDRLVFGVRLFRVHLRDYSMTKVSTRFCFSRKTRRILSTFHRLEVRRWSEHIVDQSKEDHGSNQQSKKRKASL